MWDSSLYQTRSRSRTMLAPYLPEDIIMNILCRVPAEFWDKHIKYVCKTWASIPDDSHFIKMHLLHSKPCLYIQDTKSFGIQFIEINGLKSNVVYRRSPLPGEIIDSNDGLILIRVRNPPGVFYVANPITKQVMYLYFEPQPSIHYAYSLAKIVRTQNGQVKVIFYGLDAKDPRGTLYWYVLTVGSDRSWREISCAGAIKGAFYPSVTIAVGGVAYWNNRYDIRYTLAVDLNDETSHLLVSPEGVTDVKKNYDRWHFVKMGNRLCLASWIREINEIKLWILKDLRQNIWEKILCVEIIRGNIMKLGFTFLVTYLDDQQLLIFQVHSRGKTRLLAVDVKTRKVKTMKKFPIYSTDFGVHINSLVAL